MDVLESFAVECGHRKGCSPIVSKRPKGRLQRRRQTRCTGASYPRSSRGLGLLGWHIARLEITSSSFVVQYALSSLGRRSLTSCSKLCCGACTTCQTAPSQPLQLCKAATTIRYPLKYLLESICLWQAAGASQNSLQKRQPILQKKQPHPQRTEAYLR